MTTWINRGSWEAQLGGDWWDVEHRKHIHFLSIKKIIRNNNTSSLQLFDAFWLNDRHTPKAKLMKLDDTVAHRLDHQKHPKVVNAAKNGRMDIQWLIAIRRTSLGMSRPYFSLPWNTQRSTWRATIVYTCWLHRFHVCADVALRLLVCGRSTCWSGSWRSKEQFSSLSIVFPNQSCIEIWLALFCNYLSLEKLNFTQFHVDSHCWNPHLSHWKFRRWFLPNSPKKRHLDSPFWEWTCLDAQRDASTGNSRTDINQKACKNDWFLWNLGWFFVFRYIRYI